MPFDALLDPIRHHVDSLGFELVDLKRSGPSYRPLLQIRIDRPESTPGHGVTAEDCVLVTRSLQRMLNGEPGGPQYLLQVSSPGFERPVRYPEHWRRYIGREVRIRSEELEGHPRGRVIAVPDDEHVTVLLAEVGEVTFALRHLREATLVEDRESWGKP